MQLADICLCVDEVNLNTGLEGLDPREGPPDSALSTVTLLALSLPPLCSRHVYIIHPTASYHAG